MPAKFPSLCLTFCSNCSTLPRCSYPASFRYFSSVLLDLSVLNSNGRYIMMELIPWLNGTHLFVVNFCFGSDAPKGSLQLHYQWASSLYLVWRGQFLDFGKVVILTSGTRCTTGGLLFLRCGLIYSRKSRQRGTLTQTIA